jgi:hypothetical protein
MKKILKIFLYLILAIVAGLFILRQIWHEKEPQGTESPETDQVVQTIYTNLNKTAWDSTAWVEWTFRGGHHYVWDKAQNRLWLRQKDEETILDLTTQQGTAKKGGVLVSGAAAEKMLKNAYQAFCNDSYWLTAPFKLTDPGTTRTMVTLADGRKGMKVTFGSGGVTPGDSYVWILDKNGIPSSFKMWVSILPIGGVEATWEQWIELPTGAKLSTFHLLGGRVKSAMTDVKGGMGYPGF